MKNEIIIYFISFLRCNISYIESETQSKVSSFIARLSVSDQVGGRMGYLCLVCAHLSVAKFGSIFLNNSLATNLVAKVVPKVSNIRHKRTAVPFPSHTSHLQPLGWECCVTAEVSEIY